MREVLKKLYEGTISLAETIISMIMALLFSSCNTARGAARLKDTGKGKDAFVLANGPALKGVVDKYLDMLKENDCIVLNFFGNTDVFRLLKPKYYVLLDPAFFGGDSNERINESIKRLIDNFQRVDWNMTLFVPASNGVINNAEKRINNARIKVVPFNATRIVGFKGFRNWMYAHNMGLPSTKNVLFPAIMLMLNLGYEHVYLYGAEFSWVKTYNVDEENGKIYTDDVHFYGNDRIYLEKGGFCFDMGCLYEALKCTYMIQDYTDYIGRQVVNRTKGSFIDAFPYENPDKLES